MLLLATGLLVISACNRPPEDVPVVRETVETVRTVVVKETVIVERLVEVTPTPTVVQGPVTVHLNLGTEPLSIDPSLVIDNAGVDVVENLFLGLTGFDAEGNVEPELAAGWSASEDGLTWTFTLRNDVRWVRYTPSAGVVPLEPVTADDIVFAVRRTCDPRTGSDYAFVNYIIAGCQRLHKADPAALSAEALQTLVEGVAVKALDEYTVQFTLEAPAGYFPAIAGLWVNRPQHRPTVEQYGARWTEPGYIVTNGPYVLAGWFHGDHMSLLRNPLWPGWSQAPGNIERVELAMWSDDTDAFARYREGELDSVTVPPTALAQVREDPTLSQELTIFPMPCTEYYGFTHTRPPMDNVLVRRALSAAIDRVALVEQVTGGGEIPANTFAPPTVFGSAAGDPTIAPWALPETHGGWGYAQALAQARAWLAEAGFPNGAGFPPLVLMHNAAESRALIAQAVAEMWRNGLGIEVQVESREWREYLGLLNSNAAPDALPHVWRLGYCGDYPDQNNWLHEVFNTDQGANLLRWQASAEAPLGPDGRSYNELTDAARRSTDPEERRALYREAERILADTAAAFAPLYHYNVVNVTKPYLQRTFYTLGGNRFETWTLDWAAKQKANVQRRG
ncbi:MAG: peptide ABC transporter substrate-binding protein [Anaerolineae bacterium]|nr:peptide ABC transporter substrate-binding protein [Anaerolineae bacterium]